MHGPPNSTPTPRKDPGRGRTSKNASPTPIPIQACGKSTSIRLNLMVVLCPNLFIDGCELLVRRRSRAVSRSSSCRRPVVRRYNNSGGRRPTIQAIPTCFDPTTPTHYWELLLAPGWPAQAGSHPNGCHRPDLVIHRTPRGHAHEIRFGTFRIAG
jgi:hypothetical protein